MDFLPNDISIKLEPEIVLLQSESESEEDDNFTPEKIEVVPELVLDQDDDEDDDENDNCNESNVNYGATNSNWQSAGGFEDSFYDDEQEEDGNDSITYDQLKLQHEMEESLQSGENDEYYDDDDDDVILIDSDDDSNMMVNNDNQMGLLDEDKSFSCLLCQKKVSTSYNLKRHMMIHTGEKPYGCDLCEKRFREFSDLKKHRKRHTMDLHFKCMVCKTNPPSPYDPTKCVKCLNAAGYGVRIVNRNHLSTNNGSNRRNIYQQPYQQQRHYQRPPYPQQQLQNHQRIVKIRNPDIPRLEGNKRAYICTFCDRIFGSSSNLKRHIMIHTGEKPYTCTVCNRPFRELSTLRKHQATHYNESTIIGEIDTNASSSSNLTTLSTFSNQQMEYLMGKDMETICTICYKFFKSKEHLHSHMLTHD